MVIPQAVIDDFFSFLTLKITVIYDSSTSNIFSHIFTFPSFIFRIQLLYEVVLVYAVQQSESLIHIRISSVQSLSRVRLFATPSSQ